MLRNRFLLADSQLKQLETHRRLLEKWNRVINLTRVDDPELRHFGESIFLASQLPTDITTVADVGSGGGFPGFPIAVYRPELTVTLIESDRRKASFLKELARTVTNVRVLSQRAEDVDETFDYVVSRAVSWADLQNFAAHLSPRMAVLSSEAGRPGFDAIPLPWDETRFVLRST